MLPKGICVWEMPTLYMWTQFVFLCLSSSFESLAQATQQEESAVHFLLLRNHMMSEGNEGQGQGFKRSKCKGIMQFLLNYIILAAE